MQKEEPAEVLRAGRTVLHRLPVLFLLVSAGAAPTAPVTVRRARYLMGTVCEATVEARDERLAGEAAEAALETIAQVERLISTWREDSELSRLNREAAAGPVTVSPPLFRFLSQALGLAAATGGAFDPTIGPLVDAWDLRGEGRIPTGVERARARAKVGYRFVLLDPRTLTARYRVPGVRLDAGAIGKGYALDRAAATLRDLGVGAALLDFGGQVLAIGAPAGEDGWRVGLADPLDRSEPAAVLDLRDASVAGSAQRERGRLVGGRLIGHVLDPRTGKPVDFRGSVSALAPTAAEADALSTALLVLGPREGRARVNRMAGAGAAWLLPEVGGDGLTMRADEGFLDRVEAVRRDVRVMGRHAHRWRRRLRDETDHENHENHENDEPREGMR